MELHEAPRGGDGAKKISSSCGVGQGWGKTKFCEVGVKILSFGLAPPHCHP